MRTPGRWRRWGSWLVRWGGLTLVAVLVSAFMASLWVEAWCKRGPPASGRVVYLGLAPGGAYRHRTLTLWAMGDGDGPPPTEFEWHLGWRNASRAPAWPDTWWVEHDRGVYVGMFTYVPLWMPLLPSLLVTALAWWPHRRSMRWTRAGLCPACGYSMAGNTTGVCPECGAGRP